MSPRVVQARIRRLGAPPTTPALIRAAMFDLSVGRAPRCSDAAAIAKQMREALDAMEVATSGLQYEGSNTAHLGHYGGRRRGRET